MTFDELVFHNLEIFLEELARRRRALVRLEQGLHAGIGPEIVGGFRANRRDRNSTRVAERSMSAL